MNNLEISSATIDQLAGIARRAGLAIMEVYAGDFSVEIKNDASPVTEADRRAEELILAELEGPVPVVAEELAAAGRLPDIGAGPFWLVDPLDGTKEFIRRNGEFTVNIALICDGRPLLGVVYAPALDEMFVGGPMGAFADTGGGMHPIACRRPPKQGLTALVSRHHKGAETEDFLSRFPIADEISAGSSLKFCRLAQGQADIYPRIGRTMEWDTAAGHAVVLAAGGFVADMEGRELCYGKPGFANPHFVASGFKIVA